MDIQARDDDKLITDGYAVSFNILFAPQRTRSKGGHNAAGGRRPFTIADGRMVSNQSINIIPTWSKSERYDLTLKRIIFDNIKIDVNEGILTVCDITTFKCGNHIQKGNVLNDPDSSLEIKFKTPLYDWLLDSIL